MTRFARAKGSKSCNEKTPEEATSWLELKKSIESKQTPINVSAETASNKKENVKSRDPIVWASLNDDTVESNFALIRAHHNRKENIETNGNVNAASENGIHKKRKKKLNDSALNKEINVNNKVKNNDLIKKEESAEINSENVNLPSVEINHDAQKNRKKQKLNKLISDKSVEREKIESSNIAEEKSNKLVKQKKLNPKGSQSEAVKNFKINKKPRKLIKNEGKSKKFNKSPSSFRGNGTKNFNAFNGNNFKNKDGFKNKKNKFNRNNDNYDKNAVEEIIVNGEKIQIVKFQGFNVTLEDAERLKKLRTDMFKEGISKDKLEAALKLERRRAEKSLSRLKKAVCFHCRGRGHVLSQCPALIDSENTGTGICYKCGSTEHSALDCKVVRGSSFQFAECFICKEQGHIARQCPDNPRGLYPHGGACRECGDVTHLKKDCPKTVSKKSDETMTICLQGEGNLESLDEELIASKEKNSVQKVVKKSVVKF